MKRVSRLVLISLGLVLCVLASLSATSDETAPEGTAAPALEEAQGSADGVSQEAAPAEAVPEGYVEVDCAVAAKIIREGEPVQSSNPNCICPHAGWGWIMTGDSCTLSDDGATCSGECYWEDPIQQIGTGTPCGTP